MSVQSVAQQPNVAANYNLVERAAPLQILNLAKKLVIVALPVIALANIPVAEAGPVSYAACLAVSLGAPFAALTCLPFLGPWCP